ncbi:MAG: hypothetical protein HXY20_12325 [Acidobacteria bacterium]|nr:hypothetical protein [Acidobacteriota bacterium]
MSDWEGQRGAREDLLYIRRTLEAAERFTAVPGKSLMAAGVVALAGVAANAHLTGAPWSQWPPPAQALDVWGLVLAVSLAIVSFGIHGKAARVHGPLKGALLRKLLWSFCPALFVGALLTSLSIRYQSLGCLPAIWLGCYGAAVANGGQVSVPPVRYMGLSFIAAAAGAALTSPSMGLAWLGMGFGWLHVVFGAYIAWRYHG